MEVGEKKYDLEKRTAIYAERVRTLCLRLPKNIANSEYFPQLIRSSASVAANYIEANETIGDKDFIMKIKTCRRESKESGLFLGLLIIEKAEDEVERNLLRQEAKEFILIFTSILKKRGSK